MSKTLALLLFPVACVPANTSAAPCLAFVSLGHPICAADKDISTQVNASYHKKIIAPSYFFCHILLPLYISWSIFLDEVVELVIIQEGSSHISTKFHILNKGIKDFSTP